MSAQILGPGESPRTINIAGSIMSGKTDGTTSDNAFAVAEGTLQPGGFVPPLHLHREMAEHIYLLSGRLDVRVGDERRVATPGTYIAIPAGVPHTMSVVGEEPAKALMIMSNPARAMQMVETLEQVFANGEPEPETAGPLLAQLDMEMLEPVAL